METSRFAKKVKNREWTPVNANQLILAFAFIRVHTRFKNSSLDAFASWSFLANVNFADHQQIGFFLKRFIKNEFQESDVASVQFNF